VPGVQDANAGSADEFKIRRGSPEVETAGMHGSEARSSSFKKAVVAMGRGRFELPTSSV
jgi:hypothetical protein